MNPLQWVKFLSDDPVTQLQLSVAFLMVFVGLAYVVGRYGQSKGYPFSPPFFLCFLISPIAVVLILALLPNHPEPPKPMPLDMLLEIEKARIARMDQLKQGNA